MLAIVMHYKTRKVTWPPKSVIKQYEIMGHMLNLLLKNYTCVDCLGRRVVNALKSLKFAWRYKNIFWRLVCRKQFGTRNRTPIVSSLLHSIPLLQNFLFLCLLVS